MAEARDVEDLIETRRITDVIHTLFVATDRRDWPAVHGALAERVAFDMTSLGGAKADMAADEITSAWDSGLKPIESVHHQVGNLAIEVRGDRAAATCYGIAYHYRRTRSGRNTRVFVGSYDLGLHRRDGRWRIDAFTFNLKFLDGNLELDREPTE